jgi:hypothetical protein
MPWGYNLQMFRQVVIGTHIAATFVKALRRL